MKHLLAATVFIYLAFSVSLVRAEDKRKLSSVADLRYGVALYHYFQKSYLDALTELMVAEKRGGIKGHGDNPEIMKGGFVLAYGMEQTAEEIFDRVLAQNTSEKAQAAAWFYMAKMRYMSGDYMGAGVALGKMPEDSYRHIQDDVTALRINIAIKQNDLELAENILKKEKPKQGWMPYLNYNVGSALARQQEFERAIIYFDRLAEDQFKTREHRALYDKAMTAAGFCYLLSQRYDKALKQFSTVRLNSQLSGRALLGYGWAAVEKGDYKEALKAWNHLTKQTLVDENSQESLVAVPYAYEKLGAEGLALQRFQQAENAYVEEIARVDAVIANLEGEQMLEALNISSSEGIDWMRYAKEHQLSPELSYLVSLFSREEFQSLVQELRDLLAIQENTHGWAEKLNFYTVMLNERERSRTANTAILAEERLRKKIESMNKQRAALVLKIETIAANRDYFALATESEADLINRVQRDKKYVEALREEDPFIDETEEAVRRYYGLLMWDSAEKFSNRLWLVIKKLNTLDETLKEIRTNYANVQRILQVAPDMSGYRNKIKIAQSKLVVQQKNVDNAVEKTKAELQKQIVSVLQAQRQRLNIYLSQSRLSIARLYDKARVEELKKTQPKPEKSSTDDASTGSNEEVE